MENHCVRLLSCERVSNNPRKDEPISGQLAKIAAAESTKFASGLTPFFFMAESVVVMFGSSEPEWEA